MDALANYERSYKSMWREIEQLRRQRDAGHALDDAVRDLAIALRHDLGSGTKASEETLSALNRIESRLADHGTL